MSFRSRLDAALARGLAVTVRWLFIVAGLWTLYHYGLEAFGGHDRLWLFERLAQARYTAMAMLTGTLKLRTGLSKIGLDEQVYYGASYTNWGFGVPLLQIPFHLGATLANHHVPRFFPDRAIFFSYYLASLPLIWAGFDRLLAMREPLGASKLRRHVVSWAATVFVLTNALFPLMSCQFTVYVETISYFVLAELLAIAAFIFAVRRKSTWAVAGLAVAAGFGFLIRQTGPLYLGMWAVLVLLELRTRRNLIVFASILAPFVVFWALTNWEKTGSILSFGFQNSLPGAENMRQVRFGSPCADTPAHTLQIAGRLFNALFGEITHDPDSWPWLKKCFFHFEYRPMPSGISDPQGPYLGVAFFVAMAWMVLHQAARRVKRIAVYAPAALFLLIFSAYVWAGVGFSWRYMGDFWPLLVLTGVQYVRFLPRVATPLFGLPLALVLIVASGSTYVHDVKPYVTTLETITEAEASHMYDDFTNWRWATDSPMPTHLTCDDHPRWPYHNGTGWEAGCAVGVFTNVYIGVPQKNDDHYVLSFETEGISRPTLPLYLNGRIYVAHKVASGYVAEVSIHYDRLTSPIVMLTIEWTREFDPPPGVRLRSVELR